MFGIFGNFCILKRSMSITSFFLPHQFHHRKSHLLQHYSFLSYAVLFLLFGIAISTLGYKKSQVLGFATNIKTEDVITFTNVERQKNGDGPVVYNSALSKAAEAKARDMFAKNYWAHFGPNGEKPWDFIKQSGYTYVAAGENLARDFDDSQSVVTAWMNSPSHRENLLNKNYKDIGVAVVNGSLLGHDTTLVVQMFGKPFQESQVLSGQEGGLALQPATKNTLPTTAPVLSPLPERATSSLGAAQVPIVSILSQRFILLKSVSVGLIALVVVLLAIDAFVMHKRRVVRIATHSLAHASVLVVIVIIIFFASRGAII